MTFFLHDHRYLLTETLKALANEDELEDLVARGVREEHYDLSEAINQLGDINVLYLDEGGEPAVRRFLRDDQEFDAVAKFAQSLNEAIDSAGYGSTDRELVDHPKFEDVMSTALTAYELIAANDRQDPPIHVFSRSVNLCELVERPMRTKDPVGAKLFYALPTLQRELGIECILQLCDNPKHGVTVLAEIFEDSVYRDYTYHLASWLVGATPAAWPLIESLYFIPLAAERIAGALYNVRDATSLKELAKLVRHSDERVRKAAKRSLKQFRTSEARQILAEAGTPKDSQ